jgi:UDP-glucuronate 4-epimerase
MRALVTGAAGFIGSHLAERLASGGWDVVAVDCLTPYYDVEQKHDNLASVRRSTAVEVHDADLRTADLAELLHDVDIVFHQAGQPGVRASWADFDSYVEHNLLATRRVLEAAVAASVSRVVFASSSSVYGNIGTYPTFEEALPRPQSPYGVTKLAAEHLCGVYARNWGLSTVALRYFTVYGPRQRPDMAMHRLVEAALHGRRFPMFGTGEQIRDFTYVDDVVAANIAAASADITPGTVINVAGGGSTSLIDVIKTIERLTGRTIALDRRPVERGDVDRTGGAIDRARCVLGWSPRISVDEGLEHQVEWHTRRPVPADRPGDVAHSPPGRRHSVE